MPNKPDVVASGYSDGYADNCTQITGIEDSEHDVEYPLFLGNKEIGTIRVHYAAGYLGSWDIELRGTKEKFSVQPIRSKK